MLVVAVLVDAAADAGADDEQQIERMYEMLDSYHQKRSARQRDARPTGTTGQPCQSSLSIISYAIGVNSRHTAQRTVS